MLNAFPPNHMDKIGTQNHAASEIGSSTPATLWRKSGLENGWMDAHYEGNKTLQRSLNCRAVLHQSKVQLCTVIHSN